MLPDPSDQIITDQIAEVQRMIDLLKDDEAETDEQDETI